MSNEKDVAEKTLVSCNDVFADIVNALLFQGKEVVKENELVQSRTKSGYSGEQGLRDQERDEAKFWKQKNIHIALIGFENQTEEDTDMPIRVIGYDGAAYRDQLYQEKGKDGKRRRNTNKRYPVVTLVLYFGMNHWKKPLTLYENFGGIDEEIKPYVNDYKVNLFEIAWLTDEQIKLFKSDFRFLAEYFSKLRNNEEYIGSNEEIIHVKELMDLLQYLTKDSRYREIYQKAEKEGKEIHTMCEVLDRAEERGKAKERLNTERERVRAEEAEARIEKAEARIEKAEAKAEEAEAKAEEAEAKAEEVEKKLAEVLEENRRLKEQLSSR